MIVRIRGRALRRLQRAYSDAPSSTPSSTPSSSPKPAIDAVRDKDHRLYGGLKSWDILTEESSTHARRDKTTNPLWHAWQLATASAVPIGLLLYCRSVEDSARARAPRIATLGAQGESASEASGTEVAGPGTAQPASLADLERRLERIERRLAG